MIKQEEGTLAEANPWSGGGRVSQAGSEQVDQSSAIVERPLAEVNPSVGERKVAVKKSRKSASFCVNTVRVTRRPLKGTTDILQYRRWSGTIVERRGGSKKLKTGRAHPLVQRGRRQAFVRPKKLNQEVISKYLSCTWGLKGNFSARVVSSIIVKFF